MQLLEKKGLIKLRRTPVDGASWHCNCVISPFVFLFVFKIRGGSVT